jgi:cytochrome d ubiquinol oxidase subunit II
VGVLLPFITKEEKERRILINAIGPFWDGNEVWLLTAGGALFAAFPHVYATVFSGFYLALMLVLFGLIFRAVSFEFRNQVESPAWQRMWDWLFFLGSLLPGLLTGVAMGNIVRGVPLDAQFEYAGDFFTLLNPFALLFGFTGLSLFIMQGANYIRLKTNGEMAERGRKVAKGSWVAVLFLALALAVFGGIYHPERYANLVATPVYWLIPVLAVVFLMVTRVILNGENRGLAFLFSSLTIASFIAIIGLAIYPNMLPASNMDSYSLTIFNASASLITLRAMLIIALIGMPLVIGYTSYIYYVFRGKAEANSEY